MKESCEAHAVIGIPTILNHRIPGISDEGQHRQSGTSGIGNSWKADDGMAIDGRPMNSNHSRRYHDDKFLIGKGTFKSQSCSYSCANLFEICTAHPVTTGSTLAQDLSVSTASISILLSVLEEDSSKLDLYCRLFTYVMKISFSVVCQSSYVWNYFD